MLIWESLGMNTCGKVRKGAEDAEGGLKLNTGPTAA